MITTEQIIKARKEVGLTQAQAAALIHKSCRAWQQYESGERKMDQAYWELFMIKIKNS
jgi:DNA-binding transcriptional regulator YiaG